MECTEAREEFSALLDDELAPEVRAAVEAHLTDCSACLRALAECKRVDALYRGLPVQRAPEDFEERVRAAVHPKIVRFPRRAAFERKRVWPLLAAAATFLVIVGGLVVQQQRLHRGRFDIAAAPESKRGPSAVDSVATQKTRGRLIAEFEGLEEAPKPAEVTEQDKQTWGTDELGAPRPQPAPEPLRTAEPLAPEGVEVPALAEEMEPPAALPKRPGPQPELAREVAAPRPEPLSRGLGIIEQDMEELVSAQTHTAKFKKDETKATAIENAVRTELPPATPPPAPAPPVLRAPETVGAAQTLLADSAETAFAGKEIPAAPLKTTIAGDTAAPAEKSSRNAYRTGYTGTPGAASESRRTIAGRVFNFRDGTWRQKGYRSQKTTVLERDSEELRTLTERHPEVAGILALGDRVVFRLDDTWYELAAPVAE